MTYVLAFLFGAGFGALCVAIASTRAVVLTNVSVESSCEADVDSKAGAP